MKIRAKIKRAMMDDEGNCELTLSVLNKFVLEQVKHSYTDRDLVVDIKNYNCPRSLEANNYFWVLVNSISIELKTRPEEVYLNLLEGYGTNEVIPFWKEKADSLKKCFKMVKELGDTTLTDKKGKKQDFTFYACYKGSSEYDRAEMAHLIECTVEEAKNLGIDTRTPQEIAKMVKAWRG